MSRDIGQYKIFNQIGKGSFGKVYKGVDKVTNQEVALKFIQKKQKRSRDLKNLRQQNQLLKKINHPNVICLKDVIETSKQIIIVTDYAGRDLSGVIQEKKKFPLDKVKQYTMQILNAMLYLNDNRIIHRDLKPQNILIKNNHIKICDFGFAKKLSASTNFLQSMKGTPLYLAPQIVRQTKYTQKVDIWSFGCIIYELFTGRTPYYANTYQKLAPLILYQQVQYPKQMPADLKDLISSMLQKNPSARPNWQQLKQHPFFKQNDALRQKIQNQLKQVVSIQIPDNFYVQQVQHNKQNNKQNKPFEMIESKVIQKLDNQNQIKGYEQDFKKINAQLLANVIDGNQLRRDIIFLHKIKTVLHQRSLSSPHITNQLLDIIFNILNQLIKNKKNFVNEIANQNMTAEEDDITKNQALIIGILCLAKVQNSHEMLEKQLRMICLLIKRNFNGIAINTQIDEQITQFVAQILLQNNKTLPIECIRNGLIIIGTLANQAMMTINNSFTYFQRIAQDNLLSKIANIYKKEQKSAIIMQCLKQFIHPVRQISSMNGNNPHNILHPKLSNVFRTLKQQVSSALLRTDFMSQESPLQVYRQKSSHLVDYCEIMLECLLSSKQFRKQFLRYEYWSELLNCKKTKMFLFAFNSIFIKEQGRCIIPKQSMATFTKQSQQNKLINIYIVEMGYDNLKKKTQKLNNRHSSRSIVTFEKSILQKIVEFLFIDEAVKSKSCKEIYGALQTTSKRFDQPIISIFADILEGLANSENSQANKQACRQIFKKICNITNPFKPNPRTLLKLISLFIDNQTVKVLRNQKSVHLFFYQCLSDFIRREDYQYLQVQFQEKDINVFIGKFVQCLNWLMEVQDSMNKGGSNVLSQNALSLSKEIQTSCFYRFMFLDNLNQEQFCRHIKYSQTILNKTAQVQQQFINFLGVKVIPMCKNFINSKNQNILIEIFVFLSPIARDHPQFNNQIFGTQIISKFKEWLTQSCFSEPLKQKVLYLVGNLAKKSQFFFGQFQTYAVLESITSCLQKYHSNVKIFKNAIYSVGNISYYSQKFHKQITPMIPYFIKTFDTNDIRMKNNLISTISNLVRYSNVYLDVLIKTGIISNILKIACQTKQADTTFSLALSVITKIILYEQFYKSFGCKQLQIIYQKRNICTSKDNLDKINKIKEALLKANQL